MLNLLKNNHDSSVFNCKKLFMDSFNITITIQDQPISLTLQPGDSGDYKVIYHDMLVGELVKSEYGKWEELPIDQVSPGIYKMYEHHDSRNTPKIVLDEKTIAEIGEEIDRKQG